MNGTILIMLIAIVLTTGTCQGVALLGMVVAAGTDRGAGEISMTVGVAMKSLMLRSPGVRMFHGLLLRTITTLLFTSPFLSVSWSQDKG
jgi:hypothetical protein